MKEQAANAKITTKLMFRLLPVQVLLGAVTAVNGIISSFFASNYVGVNAMSAVGLYSPINMLITAVGLMLMGGSVILCGKYMGKNQLERMQNVFSLDLVLSALIAALFILLYVFFAAFDLTGIFTKDAAVRPLFNQYILGQAIGLFPLLLANQLPAFLAMENKGRRTIEASFVFVAVNVLLNYLFVQLLHMEAFGLALASSLGLWVFFGMQILPFFSEGAHLRASVRGLQWGESIAIVKTGVPGALSNGYQTLRGFIVNHLLEVFVGSVGISAFATADNVMRIFWSVPMGMVAVSRLLISVSIGEEDRQTLTDIMRVVFSRYVPLMCSICAMIILCSVPITRLFYRDPAEPVYMMTAWGLRLLPLCMPMSILCMHFTCYGQASGKQGLVHVLSVLDGVVCVAGFTALLIRAAGMNSVYYANILNGTVSVLVIIAYAWWRNRRFPRNIGELMVIPRDFGAPEEERMDLTVRRMDEVVSISREVQAFCLEKGIDRRRAYLAGLAMEEMAGNIVEHGFRKDKKSHTVDVRVVHKNDDLILRLKDDCVPFDPGERQRIADPEDVTKNIGLRMVFGFAQEVQYQNIMGLNVLTIRI